MGNLILLYCRLNLLWLLPTQDRAKDTAPAGHLSHAIQPQCSGLRVSAHASSLSHTSSLPTADCSSGLLEAEPPTISSSWDLALEGRARQKAPVGLGGVSMAQTYHAVLLIPRGVGKGAGGGGRPAVLFVCAGPIGCQEKRTGMP